MQIIATAIAQALQDETLTLKTRTLLELASVRFQRLAIKLAHDNFSSQQSSWIGLDPAIHGRWLSREGDKYNEKVTNSGRYNSN